jgi:hypothetical protein
MDLKSSDWSLRRGTLEIVRLLREQEEEEDEEEEEEAEGSRVPRGKRRKLGPI